VKVEETGDEGQGLNKEDLRQVQGGQKEGCPEDNLRKPQTQAEARMSPPEESVEGAHARGLFEDRGKGSIEFEVLGTRGKVLGEKRGASLP
jgi:hypothetical protein